MTRPVVREQLSLKKIGLFYAKTAYEPKSGCLLWTGCLASGTGYGLFGVTGHGNVSAHRMAWVIAAGSIPDGMFVLHRCDTPRCVRLSHLFLGTQSENILDCVHKGHHTNAAKTHCPRGHLYSEENTYLTPSTGHRKCLMCAALFRERRRGLAQAG